MGKCVIGIIGIVIVDYWCLCNCIVKLIVNNF